MNPAKKNQVEKKRSKKPGLLSEDPSPKAFKVLLVYPNYAMVNLLPLNIGILTACLRQNGFQVDLFDATFYKTTERTIDEIRVENLQVRKFSLQDYGVHFKKTDFREDFVNKVRVYKPDLIGVTCVEDTWPQTRTLLESVRDTGIPVVVGGVFPTMAPEIPIAHPDVDMICIGEGEQAMVELASTLMQGRDPSAIKNLWVKKDGGIIKNPLRPLINLDDLPIPDFDLFEKERFYRPMQGKVVRMIPLETDRGCPYQCKFCEAPSLARLYRKETGEQYFRRKKTARLDAELALYTQKYGVEYIYFNAETFLAVSDQDLKEFVRMYKKYRLPYWCQTRIETFTEERLQALVETNCNRISIGIEHGNEDFRRQVIGKTFSNEQVLKAVEMIRKTPIPITVNNILGFPDDTRELIFDTIELNRQLNADSVNAYYFMPYRGTMMRRYAEDKGLITKDTETDSLMKGPVMNLPGISKDEIVGLVRTFSLYVKFPKSEWPQIRIAEQLTDEGNKKFQELSRIYYERFFNPDGQRSVQPTENAQKGTSSGGKLETEIITN